MKYFFRRKVPTGGRLLLIESGSRRLMETQIAHWRQIRGDDLQMDLVTCYPGAPTGFDAGAGQIFRVTEFTGGAGRGRLYRALKNRDYRIAIAICSGEPIMTKWKWMLGARLPVKILILNENADFFWLDRGNWRTIRHFVLFRAGLTGSSAVRTITGLAIFPLTLAYLLIYTAFVHLRRKVHA